MTVEEVLERVKLEMKNQGITQKELAERIYSDQGTISSWLSGRFEPFANNLLRLCDGVGLEIELKEAK